MYSVLHGPVCYKKRPEIVPLYSVARGGGLATRTVNGYRDSCQHTFGATHRVAARIAKVVYALYFYERWRREECVVSAHGAGADEKAQVCVLIVASLFFLPLLCNREDLGGRKLRLNSEWWVPRISEDFRVEALDRGGLSAVGTCRGFLWGRTPEGCTFGS